MMQGAKFDFNEYSPKWGGAGLRNQSLQPGVQKKICCLPSLAMGLSGGRADPLGVC